MALNAVEFLEVCARDHQVPAAVVAQLRQQIASAGRPVAPATVAKYLVDKKHLTAEAVRGILSSKEPQTRQSSGTSDAQPKTAKPQATRAAEEQKVRAGSGSAGQRSQSKSAPKAAPRPAPVEEDLGLAPDDEDDGPRSIPPPPAKPAAPTKSTTSAKSTVPVKTSGASPTAGNRNPSSVKPVAVLQTLTEDDLGLAPDETEFPAATLKPSAVAAPANSSRPPGKQAASASQAKTAATARPNAASVANPKKPAPGKTGGAKPNSADIPDADLFDEMSEPLAEYKDDADDPLGGVANLSLADLAAESAGATAGPLAAAKAVKPRRSRPSGRQLGFVVGGAAGFLLLVLGGILIYNSLQSSGDPEFELAEKDYQSRANQPALEKLTEFLEHFSAHPRAGLARVHLNMSRLRLATALDRDWPEALPKIRQILDPIVGQSEFQPSRREVVSLLMRIAETLTDSAVKAANPAEARSRLAAAREALLAANEPRYIPESDRNDSLLRDLSERLTVLEYNLDRSVTLEQTLAAATQALAKHDLAAAYVARKEFIERYPDQSHARGLLELGRNLAVESQRQVRVIKEPHLAESEDAPSPATATLVLTDASLKAPAGGRVAPCFAVVRGTVYALDSMTGRILWRRATASAADRLPVPLGDATDGAVDVLLVDARNHSLLRVDAASGKLRWRLVVGKPLLDPVSVGKRVFVATRGGLIMSLDALSGQSDMQAQLPQPLAVSLAADPVGAVIHALAEHSHLYTLGTADLACEKVTCVGHEAGAVEIPPLVLPDHLIVAENRGENDSILRVLSRSREGSREMQLQEVALAGQVVTSPARDAKQLSVATVAGPTYVFELTQQADAPLKKVAEIAPNNSGRLSRYLAMRDGRLWIADAGMRSFAITGLAARAKRAWQGFAADPVAQPLQISNDVVICGRNAGDDGATLISAISAGTGELVWETRLGLTPVGPWIDKKDATSLMVTRMDGNIYRIDVGTARGLVRCKPLVVAPEENSEHGRGDSGTISDCLPFADDRQLMLRGPMTASTVNLSAQTSHAYALPGALLCSPVNAAGGVFAVCQPGEIYFLPADSDQPKVEPFMPLVRPADRPAWHLAGAAIAGEQPFVVAVRGKQLYGIIVRAEPIPHLATLGTAELPASLEAVPAVAGKLACVSDQAGNLQSYLLPEFKAGPTWSLGSAVVWGPRAAGSAILAATDDGHLHCVDAKAQQLRWKIKLAHAAIAGVCVKGEKLFVASRNGMLSRFSLATGKEDGVQDLGEPLADGPLNAGLALVVATAEGSLLKVPAP